MKLCILLDKVYAGFWAHTKAGIGIELTRIPMPMSYIQALSGFRNEVNRKFPPQLGSNYRSRRTIHEVGQGRGRGHFGRKMPGPMEDEAEVEEENKPHEDLTFIVIAPIFL